LLSSPQKNRGDRLKKRSPLGKTIKILSKKAVTQAKNCVEKECYFCRAADSELSERKTIEPKLHTEKTVTHQNTPSACTATYLQRGSTSIPSQMLKRPTTTFGVFRSLRELQKLLADDKYKRLAGQKVQRRLKKQKNSFFLELYGRKPLQNQENMV